jgi:HK97 family phage prohead protease
VASTPQREQSNFKIISTIMKAHTFLVSDETVNSYGFNILTSGIDTVNFLKNPIMLYMHERTEVIGRWENVKIEDGKLYADAVFDTNSAKGKEVADKVENGFLKAASIGFTYNEDDIVKGTLQKCLLIEISIVDVGSNPNALKLYNKENFAGLYFEVLANSSELSKVLELSNSDTKNILQAVKNLKQQNASLIASKNQIDTEREAEAKELVNFIVEREYLPKQFEEMQLQKFKTNFAEAKKEVEEMIKLKFPFQRVNLVAMIEQARINNQRENPTKKAKAEWDLDDYRQHAPQELEKNPELFQKLVNEKYKTI